MPAKTERARQQKNTHKNGAKSQKTGTENGGEKEPKDLKKSIEQFVETIGLKDLEKSRVVDTSKVKLKSRKETIKDRSKNKEKEKEKENKTTDKQDSAQTTNTSAKKTGDKLQNTNVANKQEGLGPKDMSIDEKLKAKPETNKPKKILFDDDGRASKVISEKQHAKRNIDLKAAKDKLLVEPGKKWYEIQNKSNADSGDTKLSEEAVERLLEKAQWLLDEESEKYRKQREKGKKNADDMEFVSSILKSGTLTDKLSALTLLVQESPIHNMDKLNQLMAMARKKHRREAIIALSSLKDLMITDILPNRRLKYFVDREITSENVPDRQLVLWIFEDKMKKVYFEMVKIMEEMLYDNLEYTKQSMLVSISELLENKPEQEQNLLRLLVTKLGDKDRKVASKASFLLLRLLNKHPLMKTIVIKCIQEMILSKRKPSLEKAQYYCMVTLNQIVISKGDSKAANELIRVYLDFFHTLVYNNAEFGTGDQQAGGDNQEKANSKPKTSNKKAYIGRNAHIKSKEEANKKNELENRSLENKMVAAILTGLNRALPFSDLEEQKWENYIQTLYRASHSSNFNVVIQTMMFLYQLTIVNGISSKDRFYSSLYSTLLDYRIESSSKKALYLNLLLKAMQADSDIDRLAAFVKRIFQIILYQSTPFVCGLLYLISQVSMKTPEILTLWKTDSSKNFTTYDPSKRDPRYSNAKSASYHETLLTLHNYHPTVKTYARQLLAGEPISSSVNLHIHSLSHFLDRFVYRKPKDSIKLRGISAMQPSRNDSEIVWDRNAANILVNTNRYPQPDLSFMDRFNSLKSSKSSTSKDDDDLDYANDSDENDAWLDSIQPDLDDSDADVDLDDDLDDELDDDLDADFGSDDNIEHGSGDDNDGLDDDDDDSVVGLGDDQDFDALLSSTKNSLKPDNDDLSSQGSSGSMDDDEDELDDDDDELDDDELGEDELGEDQDDDDELHGDDDDDDMGLLFESKKRPSPSTKGTSSNKKRKTKSDSKLPMLASYEDYAALIDS
ncbi:Ribosome biogenesis protein MAK21 [Zancudomyces culisetae]|uniref:Ribosome biogenesis protein MAK21 n=1 Tax=Zancudomyces culisetae TaxID=1213189 RepID=A0A1R1PGF4_ZANCU|nr:Ribosome biogenesis protein MAK21 [Zancudomyces culisetae]|eukprot:OMH80027.1 Ribosome biogenesis protein MAK21 [Zancudomyces culisetae]